VGDVVMVNEGM